MLCCRLLALLLLALLLFALQTAPAFAATVDVNATSDGNDFDTANGVCSINPPNQPIVCTLRAAIQQVNAIGAAGGGPHRINLPAGTYQVTLGGNPPLVVNANVDIVGADQTTTIVDGNATGGGLLATCGGGCTAVPKSVNISGFTFRNSGATGIQHAGAAGPLTLTNVTVTANPAVGIDNRANLTLNSVTISNNTSTGTNAVGGLFSNGTVMATNLTVSGNAGNGSGGAGGINNQGSLTITGGTVSGNTTTLGCAGGISSSGPLIALSDLAVTNNTATNQGGGGGLPCAAGGLWLSGNPSTQTLTNVQIASNQLTGAPTGNFAAGMILNAGNTTFTMTGGAVQGNSGGAVGGVTLSGNGTASFAGVTISNNAGGVGGGMFNQSFYALTLSNTTIAGNSTTSTAVDAAGGVTLRGGAHTDLTGVTVSGNTGRGLTILGNFQASGQFTNVTISGNSAGGLQYTPDFGGSIWRLTNGTIANNAGGPGVGVAAGSPVLRLLNTLVAGNGTGNCAIPASGAFLSEGSNLSSDATCVTAFTQPGDQNNVNPLLGPLANNGGATQTQALLAGSPAIDGVVSGCPPPATDQRGVSRPQGARCDIGAYEAPPACTPRPNVGVTTVRPAAGRLQVTVTATGNATTANNVIRTLRFGEARASTNDLIDVEGQTGRSGTFTVAITPPRAQVTFTVRQQAAGSPTTVNFVAVDNCGDWQTLAGGGPTAFGGPEPGSPAPPTLPAAGGSPGGSVAPTSTPTLSASGPGATGATPTASPNSPPSNGATPAAAPACSPRPALTVTTAPTGDGRLQATVSASSGVTLQTLRFGAAQNALVEAGGQSSAGSFAIALPAGTRQTTFTLARATVGQGVSVPLTVVDTCGDWPTFVGAGPSAF